MPTQSTRRTIRIFTAFSIGLVVGYYVIGLVLTEGITEETESVFVYGTLTHPVTRLFVCACFTIPEPASLHGYRKIGRNIIPDAQSTVSGEIITVSEPALRLLDRYERVPHAYVRHTVTIGTTLHHVYVAVEQ